ncbi:MAG: DUF5007 domain-containing protein [Bacteroidetes bacterium]|nr:DUF5007 domain-containing protein [Bacteroidota bacterium]
MKSINTVRKYALLLLVAAGLGACKKLDNGFISPTIRYEEDPVIIQKGRVKVSSALNLDGSSKPVSVKVLHFYDDATGAVVDDLFNTTYTIKGWTGLYDPKTDTTLELIAAKQTDMDVTPISINPVSGQVEGNYTSLHLPAGLYSFDLEITNGAGTKTYPKIGHIELVDGKPYEANPELGTPYTRMIKVGNESVGASIFSPSVSIQRVAETPNIVVLKFVDKNGVPFNPAKGEIQRRPNGSSVTQPWLQTLQDYSLKTDVYDDRFEFTYGVVPYPFISQGNGFNVYYRIPSQYFSHDNQTSYPDGTYSANPRLVFRAFVPGKYEIVFKATDLTHR